MLEKIIIYVVRALSLFKVHRTDFDKLIALVLEAERKFDSGMDKDAYVKQKAKELLEITAPYLIDLLVAITVGYLGRKGFISLSTMK